MVQIEKQHKERKNNRGFTADTRKGFAFLLRENNMWSGCQGPVPKGIRCLFHKRKISRCVHRADYWCLLRFTTPKRNMDAFLSTNSQNCTAKCMT